MWCWSVGRGILTELSLCYSIVYHCTVAQRYEQFLQFGRLYRALISLGLTVCLISTSVFSVFVVLYIYIYIFNFLLHTLPFTELSLVGLALDLVHHLLSFSAIMLWQRQKPSRPPPPRPSPVSSLGASLPGQGQGRSGLTPSPVASRAAMTPSPTPFGNTIHCQQFLTLPWRLFVCLSLLVCMSVCLNTFCVSRST